MVTSFFRQGWYAFALYHTLKGPPLYILPCNYLKILRKILNSQYANALLLQPRLKGQKSGRRSCKICLGFKRSRKRTREKYVCRETGVKYCFQSRKKTKSEVKSVDRTFENTQQ